MSEKPQRKTVPIHSQKEANVPCGCIIRWDDKDATVTLCAAHQIEYKEWKGTARDFIKKVATPKTVSYNSKIV